MRKRNGFPGPFAPRAVLANALDPVATHSYHIKFNPCTDPEISKRLIQRSDDTEEKVKVRLMEFRSNVEAVNGAYGEKVKRVDGNKSVEEVSTKDKNVLCGLLF